MVILMSKQLDELNVHVNVEVYLLLHGNIVMDSKLASVLSLVDRVGSLLMACRRFGLAYSRIWERIARAEKLLGSKLLEAKRGGRGGGGARLTDFCRNLLRKYYAALETVRPCAELLESIPIVEKQLPELVLMGSHDPLLEHLVGVLRSLGVRDVAVEWTGSMGGLAGILLGEVDVAGVHLYDAASNLYNIPFLSRFLVSDRVLLIRGYMRELVFAVRPNLKINSLKDIADGLKTRLFTVANRNKGSGTRLFFEYILKRFKVNPESIRGAELEFKTHFDTVRAVAMGNADLCLTIKYVADQYKLRTFHLTWEYFDFVVPRERYKKLQVQLFLEALKNSRRLIEAYDGYRVTKDFGKIIYPR